MRIINDVEAMAYGLNKGIDIMSNGERNKGSKLLVTMGTGTGISLVKKYQGDRLIVLASESWATNLSPDP